MRRTLLAGGLALALLGPPVAAQPPLHPGKTGAALENLVRGSYRPKPSLVLPYPSVRPAMFAKVDRQGNKVTLLYTGTVLPHSPLPSAELVNVEHVWPQSKFGSPVGTQRADMHHLFPTYKKVNTARDNHPFAEIPDSPASKWWAGPAFVTGIPGSNIDTYSESTNQRFEPREKDKGNVARAVFYFRAIYGDLNIDMPFFAQQRTTLLKWHKDDPADAAELARNKRVEDTQGNRNPFVDDPTLAARMFDPTAAPSPAIASSQPVAPEVGSLQPVAPPAAAGAAPAAVAATIQDGEEIHVMTWNVRWFFDADTNDNKSKTSKEESAADQTVFDARVTAIAGVIKNAGLPQVVALQEVENQKVVQRLADELNAVHGGKYKVGFVQGTDTYTEQEVAYLYQDRPVQVTFARIPTAGFTNPTLHKVPSKHCVMTVTHTLPTGQTQRVSLVNLHLKASPGAKNEAERRKQARVVSGFVRQQLTADPSAGFVVLGDMNAQVKFDATSMNDCVGVLRGMETPDPLDDLIDLNGDLPANQRSSHVSKRELDRILVSGALLDNEGLVLEQVVIRKDLINAKQSDHFPMVATFTYKATPGP